MIFSDAYEFIGQLYDPVDNNTSQSITGKKDFDEDYDAYSTLLNNNGNNSHEQTDPYY